MAGLHNNKGFNSEILVDYPDRHTPDKGAWAQRSKHCAYTGEVNTPHINSVNCNFSFLTFRQKYNNCL